MSPAPPCPFCVRIGRHEYDLLEPGIVGFVPLNPVTPGHYLVLPAKHITSALAKPITFGRVAGAAALLAATRRRHGDADDWNIITSVGPSATQTVRHLHVHLVPRRPGDGLTLPWTGQTR